MKRHYPTCDSRRHTETTGKLTRDVWPADMFFGLLLIPLCLSLYSLWLGVLWCALVVAFSDTCAFLCTFIYILPSTADRRS